MEALREAGSCAAVPPYNDSMHGTHPTPRRPTLAARRQPPRLNHQPLSPPVPVPVSAPPGRRLQGILRERQQLQQQMAAAAGNSCAANANGSGEAGAGASSSSSSGLGEASLSAAAAAAPVMVAAQEAEEALQLLEANVRKEKGVHLMLRGYLFGQCLTALQFLQVRPAGGGRGAGAGGPRRRRKGGGGGRGQGQMGPAAAAGAGQGQMQGRTPGGGTGPRGVEGCVGGEWGESGSGRHRKAVRGSLLGAWCSRVLAGATSISAMAMPLALRASPANPFCARARAMRPRVCCCWPPPPHAGDRALLPPPGRRDSAGGGAGRAGGGGDGRTTAAGAAVATWRRRGMNCSSS